MLRITFFYSIHSRLQCLRHANKGNNWLAPELPMAHNWLITWKCHGWLQHPPVTIPCCLRRFVVVSCITLHGNPPRASLARNSTHCLICARLPNPDVEFGIDDLSKEYENKCGLCHCVVVDLQKIFACLDMALIESDTSAKIDGKFISDVAAYEGFSSKISLCLSSQQRWRCFPDPVASSLVISWKLEDSNKLPLDQTQMIVTNLGSTIL